jgi:hypothetical protein
MSFISQENQNVLWDIVNRSPLCTIAFPENEYEEKRIWFQNFIKEYNNAIISVDDLYQVNREALARMLKSLIDISLHR